jgi:hypothetical protein
MKKPPQKGNEPKRMAVVPVPPDSSEFEEVVRVINGARTRAVAAVHQA